MNPTRSRGEGREREFAPLLLFLNGCDMKEILSPRTATWRTGFIGALLLAVPLVAQAQNGWYVSVDVGGAMASKMDATTGGLDDWVSAETAAHSSIRCDLTLNPSRFQTAPGACGDAPTEWGPMDESFGGGKGVLAALATGYRMRSFRVEGEFLYRSAAHDSKAVPTTATYIPATDKGFQAVGDAVDDVATNNALVNLYYDYHTDSKVTPFLGVGFGVQQTSIEYRTFWHRTNNINDISVFDTDGLTGADLATALKKNIGTVTSDQAKLTDTLLGYQVMAGFDYALSDPVSIGLKFRWS